MCRRSIKRRSVVEEKPNEAANNERQAAQQLAQLRLQALQMATDTKRTARFYAAPALGIQVRIIIFIFFKHYYQLILSSFLCLFIY